MTGVARVHPPAGPDQAVTGCADVRFAYFVDT